MKEMGLLSSATTKFHGLTLAKSVAKTDGHKPATVIFAINVKTILASFANPYPRGKNVAHAEIYNASIIFK